MSSGIIFNNEVNNYLNLECLVQAVIFDMDGVLVDSEPLWRRAQLEIFQPLGVAIEEKR